MRAMIFFFTMLTVGFSLGGCKETTPVEPFTLQIREIPKNLKLPDEVKKKWDELEIPGEMSQLLRIKLTLSEKNSGLLKYPVIDILFPPGGGEFDFSQVISQEKGTFNLKWLDPMGAEFTKTEIYFVPSGEASKIGGESWGDPCGQILQISTFGQKVSKDGIDLNVTDFRHIRLMGGSFIFLKKTDKSLEVAQITFTDSRFEQKKCKVL